jgi:hypothetical protein
MKKPVKFYSKEEVKEIKEIIKDPESKIREAAIVLAKKYDRNLAAVEVKMYQLRRKLHPEINFKSKKSTSKSKITKTAPEQQSADIGVEVPHGMTFEGKPKKIMLHSDHFRIYF